MTDAQSDDAVAPLVTAIWRHDLAAVEELIDQGADPDVKDAGTPALCWAVAAKEPEMVRILLKAGADPNAGAITALMRAASDGCEEIVSMLLLEGAMVNAQDPDGMTALMRAAKWGHQSTVRRLIAHGARVDARDKRGYTALKWATTIGDFPDIATLLLDEGAGVNARGAVGTPLTSAAFLGSKKTAQVLLARGADPDLPSEVD